MKKSQVVEMNVSRLGDDSISKLGRKVALIKVNRRVRAILIPVDDREHADDILRNFACHLSRVDCDVGYEVHPPGTGERLAELDARSRVADVEEFYLDDPTT